MSDLLNAETLFNLKQLSEYLAPDTIGCLLVDGVSHAIQHAKIVFPSQSPDML